MNNNFNSASMHIDPSSLKGVEYFRDFAGMLKRSINGFERELSELPAKVLCIAGAIASIRLATNGSEKEVDWQATYNIWYKVMSKSLDEAIWSNDRFRQQVANVLTGGDPDAQSPDTYGDMVTALQAAVSKYLMDELWALRY